MPEMDIMSLEIPKYVETLQLPDPQLLTYYKDLDRRCFWIDGEIGEDILDIGKKIIEFNRVDRDKPVDQIQPARIFLFTPGGLLDATLSLVNIIEISRVPVYCYNMGIAMSAGLLILLAGHKGYCLEGSRIMLHSGAGGAVGTYEQVESATKDYREVVEYMRKYILRKTKITPQMFGKKKDRDWYLYQNDQIELGIVDSVIESIDDLI
jgi:ATP-dependent Clp protease protease subunit